MNRTLIILTILLAGFTKGYSCKCHQMNLKNEIDSADLIFQGIPLDKKQIDSKMIYKFSVGKVWKGEKSDTIEIKTGLGVPDCGMIFELGKAYVVYAKHFETTYCRRNKMIDLTLDDLKLDFKFLPEFSIAFVDNQKKLNLKESEYLNRQFGKTFKDYDFTNKSIIFTYSTMIISKSDWIETNWEYESPAVELVVLTDDEKEQSGYDAILVTWSKLKISNKMKSKILKRIK
jgi:hypothetical protein